jgi:hypothetical protein
MRPRLRPIALVAGVLALIVLLVRRDRPSRPAASGAWSSAAPAPAEPPGIVEARRASPPVEVREEPEHPHPLTPERIRIHHENRLVGAMNDAVDLQDGARLRTLLDEYRENYPEDPSQLEEGYELIAGCLERPGTESQARARRYYDEERGSILRLFVARHCLAIE